MQALWWDIAQKNPTVTITFKSSVAEHPNWQLESVLSNSTTYKIPEILIVYTSQSVSLTQSWSLTLALR